MDPLHHYHVTARPFSNPRHNVVANPEGASHDLCVRTLNAGGLHRPIWKVEEQINFIAFRVRTVTANP